MEKSEIGKNQRWRLFLLALSQTFRRGRGGPLLFYGGRLPTPSRKKERCHLPNKSVVCALVVGSKWSRNWPIGRHCPFSSFHPLPLFFYLTSAVCTPREFYRSPKSRTFPPATSAREKKTKKKNTKQLKKKKKDNWPPPLQLNWVITEMESRLLFSFILIFCFVITLFRNLIIMSRFFLCASAAGKLTVHSERRVMAAVVAARGSKRWRDKKRKM